MFVILGVKGCILECTSSEGLPVSTNKSQKQISSLQCIQQTHTKTRRHCQQNCNRPLVDGTSEVQIEQVRTCLRTRAPAPRRHPGILCKTPSLCTDTQTRLKTLPSPLSWRAVKKTTTTLSCISCGTQRLVFNSLSI